MCPLVDALMRLSLDGVMTQVDRVIRLCSTFAEVIYFVSVCREVNQVLYFYASSVLSYF